MEHLDKLIKEKIKVAALIDESQFGQNKVYGYVKSYGCDDLEFWNGDGILKFEITFDVDWDDERNDLESMKYFYENKFVDDNDLYRHHMFDELDTELSYLSLHDIRLDLENYKPKS